MKEIDPGTPFCTAGTATLLAQCRRLSRLLPDARAGEDPERMRRMRVATRRLRTAMKVFRACFPEVEYSHWYSRVSHLADALGCVRDMDVQAGIIARLRDELAPEHQGDIDTWLAAHRSRRDAAHAEFVEALDTWDNDGLIALLQSLPVMAGGRKAIPKSTSLVATVPAAPLHVNASLPLLLRLEKFVQYDEEIRNPANVEELHAMRIATKRLRYTLEIFAAAVEGADVALHTLKHLQQLLGQIHDTDILIPLLEEDLDGEDSTPGIRAALDLLRTERARMYDVFLAAWDEMVADGFPIHLWNAALAASAPPEAPAHDSLPKGRLLPKKRVRRKDIAAALSRLVPHAKAMSAPDRARELLDAMDLVRRAATDPDFDDRAWRGVASTLCALITAADECPGEHAGADA